MGTYSLLADPNCAFAVDNRLRENFKAHVIFSVLTDGSLTFSDNQMMSAPNLRLLLRNDGVIREMMKLQHLTLTVREDASRGILPLREIFEAFDREGNLLDGFRMSDPSAEIDFAEQYSLKIPWTYDAVRTAFTTNSKAMVFEQARKILPDPAYAWLEEIVLEEEQRDNGLSRAFFQLRLPGRLAEQGLLPEDRARDFLRACTDAVYLSNLPRTIALNPIYAQEHRSSFQLLRGGEYKFETYGEEIDLRNRLSAEHFIAGLNSLDVGDIAYVHESDAYKAYRRCSENDDPLASFDNLFVAYAELNRLIEDRIITNHRHLMRHSTLPEPRKMRRQYGTWWQNGAAIAMDILSIAQVIPSMVGIGLASNLVIDAVRKRIDPERPFLNEAQRDLERLRLRDYLRRNDGD